MRHAGRCGGGTAALVLAALVLAALVLAAAAAFAVEPVARRTMPPTPEHERGELVEPGVWVREIAGGIWLCTTQDDPESEQPIDANGLAVRCGDVYVLVDPGWNDAQAEALMNWFDRSQSAPVRAAILTHAHNDRAGGVRQLLQRGVRVVMLDSTAAKLGLEGQVTTFANFDTLRVPGRTIEMFWPGAGHTTDNITVWIPDQHVLFGGCFLKATEWKSLGNIADSDLRLWPHSLERLKRRYRDAVIVVPGHGRVGDPRMIDHTLGLLRAKRR